ncbi:AAA family ATPase [Candidatus Pyrohabitans sp.]
MVKAELRKVIINNFKSLHDCEIDIKKLNVVVGANASGKSNLVEAFKLLKKIYTEKEINPFFEWWGYNNVVWQRKEELPITIGLLFEIEGYDVYFETTFTGIGGKFQILRELLDIKGYLKILKEGEWLTVKHDPAFIESVVKNLKKYVADYGLKTKLRKKKIKLMKEKKVKVDLNMKLLDILRSPSWIGLGYKLTDKETNKMFALSYIFSPVEIHVNYKNFKDKIERIVTLCPRVTIEGPRFLPESSLYRVASNKIFSFLTGMSILLPFNVRLMKDPQTLRREKNLKEDGSNIANVFHSIYIREGKIPDQIYYPLSMLFPDIEVRPHITDDGRVMIKIWEKGLELLPPNISDGFYKVLTILTAIYLKPSLLIIDEIENSLHPETLELILDTIRKSDVNAMITTHSPVVVDMVELSDLILVEKDYEGSRFRRIKDSDKIKEFLREKGITFSEGWLYGDLFETGERV